MKRPPKTDGFGAAERRAVHAAVRQVWHRSRARRLAVQRATDAEGYLRCELIAKARAVLAQEVPS